MTTIRVFKIAPLLFFLCFITAAAQTMAIGYYPDETFSKSLEFPKSGKIKFREDWVYKLYNGKIASTGVKIGYERYDMQGQKLEEANYTREGLPLLEITYTYDEYGREAQCLGLKQNRSFFNKWEYSFDDRNKTLEKHIFKGTSNKEKTIYRFNDLGNVVEEINYDASGDINYHYIISYTSFNKPAELIELDGNGEAYEKWLYIYNSEKQNIEVQQFDASMQLYKKYLNVFDKSGFQKEVLTFDKDGNELEKTISVYQYY